MCYVFLFCFLYIELLLYILFGTPSSVNFMLYFSPLSVNVGPVYSSSPFLFMIMSKWQEIFGDEVSSFVGCKRPALGILPTHITQESDTTGSSSWARVRLEGNGEAGAVLGRHVIGAAATHP